MNLAQYIAALQALVDADPSNADLPVTADNPDSDIMREEVTIAPSVQFGVYRDTDCGAWDCRDGAHVVVGDYVPNEPLNNDSEEGNTREDHS